MMTSVSGFAAAEQRTENRKRSFTELNHVNSDVIDRFRRTEPVNLTTSTDDKMQQKNVEVPAVRSAGTRSQFHSIQQLSQSGRPGAEATVYKQAWLGCGHSPVDVASEGDEDTLHVLRSLLRRYDSCAEPRMAVEVYDGRGNESDELASGRASNSDLHEGSLSCDDFDEDQSQIGQQVASPSRWSPSTTTLQAKRARVEHIVSNIRTPTYTEDTGASGPGCNTGASGPGCSGASTRLELDGRRRSKRKQTVPQQHDSAMFDNENHQSFNGNLSDDDDNDDDDDDDDESRTVLSRELLGDDELDLCQQLRVVQLRLEDMYAKYSKSLHARDLRPSASRSPADDDNRLESDSKMNDEAERLTGLVSAKVKTVVYKLLDANNDRVQFAISSDGTDLESDSRTKKATKGEAERLTGLLKAEFRQVIDGLVDKLIQRFLTKQFASRQRPPHISPPTGDRPRPDFPRLSSVTPLPVFQPPTLFSPLPFPVGGGDMLALRRAYAERCAFVDALVQRARTTCAADQDDVTLDYNNSTSGPTSCTTVTSASTDDRCPMMSAISSHCLLPNQQLLQPHTQVSTIS